VDQALKTWSRDLRENKGGLKGKRAPAYGFTIDLLLLKEVRERMATHLPVDDVTLRTLLVHLLEVHGRLDLMTENGGAHLFLHGWAGRFWKRHNLPSRLIPSKKMRLSMGEGSGDIANGVAGNGVAIIGRGSAESHVPAEIDVKEDTPVSAAAHLIALHNGASVPLIHVHPMEQGQASVACSQDDSDSDDDT
jgi:hypothetical protein